MAEQRTTQAILELAPSVPFVILDLAYHPSVLAWIYEEIEARSPGSWRPLLFGTAFQERWQMGPALVDLHNAPGAQHALINKYKDRFPGVFLANPSENLDELAVWLQQFLFMSRGAQESLMRIYDGRVLGSFLSVLDQQQYNHFVPPEVSWYWQNGTQWWKTSSDSQAVKLDKPDAFTWHFRDSQVDEFTVERNRAFINVLTEKYGKFTPSDTPSKYVDDAAKLAEAIGLDSKADIERVLRLLIQKKSQPDAPFYSSLIKRVDLTTYQKLDAIENGAN
ncbi:DUF4123 domain-containing protein [uncultured Marinobacter sp.]|uniref:DUF4123 domain-containing protein n=1 Tax=uncultured Marinobacter sp. TaxID=187379 RepID=UPI00262028FB|nr:DUF4123 domain-containing protein [uncultured Marinobacter sp.]